MLGFFKWLSCAMLLGWFVVVASCGPLGVLATFRRDCTTSGVGVFHPTKVILVGADVVRVSLVF